LYAKHPGCAVRPAVSDDRPDIDAAMLGKNSEPILTTEEASEGFVPGLPMAHAIVQWPQARLSSITRRATE